jgi:DNA replicative helicase MCM subunit Mcm2 (Cdc46/Mcm family)
MHSTISNEFNSVINTLELNESEFKTLFQEFISTFVTHDDDPMHSSTQNDDLDDELFDVVLDDDFIQKKPSKTPYYMNLLHETVESLAVRFPSTANTSLSNHTSYFMINLCHLRDGCSQLYYSVIHRPADCIIFMDEVISEMAQAQYADMNLQNIPIKVNLLMFISYVSIIPLISI